ncbi:WD40 repeat-like protein [Schizopora paradoxa]|uniref:DNA damage-binding protein CMR1 n=1 Tax=Schizopora paradoxa TaxID=27342 RepID=A0A0H2RPM4_9AGAM|nr:WD40 repeat-like protein [Schizopora paradoxa]
MKLTAYEQERERQIAKNKELLEQLGITEQVSTFTTRSETPPTKSGSGKPAVKRVKREREDSELAPRRQSQRLRKEEIDPNESPSQKKRRLADAEEKRKKEEEERLEAEERARRQRQPRHEDLDIPTLMPDSEDYEIQELTNTLKSVAEGSIPRQLPVAEPYVFSNTDEEKAEVAALKKRLKNMKIASVNKITSDRIYSSAYHPDKSKDLIFFGDKHGRLLIWNALAPQEEVTDEDGQVIPQSSTGGGKSYKIEPHFPVSSKSSLSCIKFDSINSYNVFTSSYDSSIRRLPFDLKTGSSEEVFSMDEVLINSFDMPPTGNEIWASDELGGLSHIDLREEKGKARRWELSDKKTGCVSINPVKPHLLLVSSNNRTLKIWDSRNLTDMPLIEGSEDTPPTYDLGSVETYISENEGTRLADYPHNKSVTAGYWDPRGTRIVSTCYDDRLRYKRKTFSSFKPFCSVMHDCQTGRWVSMLKAQWSPNPDVYPHFTVGNMKHSLDIFSCKGELLARLQDPTVISAVQAVTCSHPGIVERAASGNASGKCILWAPASEA